MYPNPFYIKWNKGWSFILFLEGGTANIEARGFGISITTKIEKGELLISGLPPKDSSVWPQTLPKRVSNDPQHFIFRRRTRTND